MESNIFLKSIPLVFEDRSGESKLLKALYDQQKKSQLCDVSLVVENVNFPAHKCVLAAHSDYFYALFDQGKQSDDAGSKACNVTTIHLSSIAINTFIPILHYLYTSRLHVFAENIRDLMRTARKLQISTIVKACDRLLSEDIVLPSLHEVRNKQSSDTIVTQSNSLQSVLYVDLRSEDDDEYQVVSAGSTYPKPVESGMGQPTESYSVEQGSSSKQRGGRTQKKKGFPKKIQQPTPAMSAMLTSNQTSPVHNISTVSPASIFGRVGANQSSRSRTIPSPMLPIISSSDNLNKSLTPSSSLTIDPLPFESNLETLFGSDSALIMEGIQSENVISTSSPIDITSCVVSTKHTDSLQLQSIFSMSPKLTAHKSTISSGEWSRYRDAMPGTSEPRQLSTMTTPVSQTGGSVLTLSSPTLQSPGATSSGEQPSVFTCKECFKYFTSLPEAFSHFYTEHQASTSSGSRQASSSHTTHIPVVKNHTCPHCGRIFNNKNNLKRHILIKHTADKRFKCSDCGRRYAIRQSLQYHMKSVHGSDADEAKTASNNEAALSPTSSYQFEPVSLSDVSTTENFSFSVAASSSSSMVDTYQNVSNAVLTTAGAYLATVLQSDQDSATKEGMVVKDDNNLPTIQRIESIRPTARQIPESSHQTSHKQKSHEQNKDVSDSKNVKAEPRGQTNHTSSKKAPAFPDSETSSGVSTKATSSAIGTPYVLTGSTNLQALLPSYTVDLSRTANDSAQNAQGRVTPRLHRCDHCARIFSTLHAYTRHRRACHKHECPICHRGFSQMGNMRRHIKIFHCDQKPYECHICHKAYGIKQSFRYHMRDKHGSTDIAKPNSTKTSEKATAN